MNTLAMLGSAFRRFCADENGATAIEYALIVGSVSIVIAATVQALGTNVKTALFDKVEAVLK